MYHFTAKVMCMDEPDCGVTYRVTDVFDHNGQPCGGMADLNTKYHDLSTMADNLAHQLGVSAENLTLVEEIEAPADFLSRL
jgi:hypothetical protein